MFGRFLGGSVLLAAAPVAAKEVKDVKTKDEDKPTLSRPQDLPIYPTNTVKR